MDIVGCRMHFCVHINYEHRCFRIIRHVSMFRNLFLCGMAIFNKCSHWHFNSNFLHIARQADNKESYELLTRFLVQEKIAREEKIPGLPVLWARFDSSLYTGNASMTFYPIVACVSYIVMLADQSNPFIRPRHMS